MSIDFKATFRSACIAAMMLSAIGISYAAEDEEESYYLSKMRENSKSSTPAVEAPTASGSLIAETDLEELAKATEEMEKVDDLTPELSKPALPSLKPKL